MISAASLEVLNQHSQNYPMLGETIDTIRSLFQEKYAYVPSLLSSNNVQNRFLGCGSCLLTTWSPTHAIQHSVKEAQT